jgi:glycyl-tRNA synthetase beta chain
MSIETKPLLIEIGVEEIPAGLPQHLTDALAVMLIDLLQSHDIALELPMNLGSTPRRLLLQHPNCPLRQADRDEVIWGPPEKVAFDANGAPTKAAEGFAKKQGLELDAFSLEDKGDGKGRYMKAVVHREGRAVTDIIAEAMPGLLRQLPCPKQMRWKDGEGRDEGFIRPIRWIVARLGNDIIPFEFAGVASDKRSFGHRILGGKGMLAINDPFAWLMKKHVRANRAERRQHIVDEMERLASGAGLTIYDDPELIDEVTDLTEWPVPVLCEFQPEFLRLPEEAIRITLKSHQRCFTTVDSEGNLSNRFFAVANIESKEPEKVAEGNARVVNARLADAAFYFDRDPKESLDARVEKLNEVVFQEGLGMVGDQVRRLRGFVMDMAAAVGADPNMAQRAAYLCKSDLTTGLVYEFPELQGYMGGVYARMQKEPEAVATAIAEHYQPTGAEDALPESNEARIIAIAERIDKLLGYFHLGKIPSASADPYGLRRAAIGVIRLLTDPLTPIEHSLASLINESAKQWNQQRVTITISPETKKAVYMFILERMFAMHGHFSVSRSALEATLAVHSERPLHRHLEVAHLLTSFADSEVGQAVAAANKRIANILKKNAAPNESVRAPLFEHEAEKHLFAMLVKAEHAIEPNDPKQMLEVLATLREPVDTFFDDVMVMCEDEKVRDNRLALLARLRALFLGLADISRL